MTSFNWSTSFDSREEAIIAFTVWGLCCIILIITLVYGFYQIYFNMIAKNNDDTSNTSADNKYTIYLLILSLIFDFLFVLITLIQELITAFIPQIHLPCSERLTQALILGLSRMWLYFFFLSRFYTTFYGTVYDITTKLYKILIISMISTLIISLCIMYYFGVSTNCSNFSFFIGAGCGLVQDIFWAIFTLILFIKGLKQVEKLCQNLEKTANIGQTQSPNKMNANTLLELSSKLTILCMVTLISTIIAYLSTMFINTSILLAVDTTINAICILLSFQFNQKWFDRLCCICKHCWKYNIRNDNKTKLASNQFPNIDEESQSTSSGSDNQTVRTPINSPLR